jgi:hypothetical protein
MIAPTAREPDQKRSPRDRYSDLAIHIQNEIFGRDRINPDSETDAAAKGAKFRA